MSRLAAELLEVLAPHLSPALVPPAALGRLRTAAPFLAPVPRLGIECRLGAAGGPVDVSQHLREAEDGPRLLRALARERAEAAAPGARGAWLGIARFAEAWGAPGPLAPGRVEEAWLEYDLESACGAATVPSVFAGFAPDAAADGLAHAVALLAPDAAEAADALARCLDEARRLGGRPHVVVGAMLSRGAESRGVVRGLSPHAAAELLRRIRWPGPVGTVAAALERFAPHALDAGLALAFAPGPAARVGIELMPGTDGDAGGRLDALLAALAEDGTCAADRAEALRGWPGAITPVRSQAAWPQALVAASLAQPAHRLGILSRFVNHLKLSVQAGRPMEAKAYLGCVHAWHEQTKERTRGG